MRKNTILLYAVIMLMMSGSALSLTNFWYSGYALDATGQIIPNSTVQVQITIIEGTTTLYQETHTGVATDQFGSLSVEVGAGTVGSGTLGPITTKSNTRVQMQTDVGPGWVLTSVTSLASAMENTTVQPGNIELDEHHVIIGDALDDGEGLPVGGDLSATNAAGVANFQVADDSHNHTDPTVADALTINGGTVNNTPIGGTTPSTGVFSDLTVRLNSYLQGPVSNPTTINGGYVFIDDYLRVSNVTDFRNNIMNQGSLNFGQVTFNDDVYITGRTDFRDVISNDASAVIPLTVGDNFVVTGYMNANGNVSLGNESTDNIDLQGTVFNTLDRVTINDGIDQTGGGQIDFSGNVDANNGLDVLGSNFTVGASQLVVNVTNGHISDATGYVEIDDNMVINGRLEVTAVDAVIEFQETAPISNKWFMGQLAGDFKIYNAGLPGGLVMNMDNTTREVTIPNDLTVGGALNDGTSDGALNEVPLADGAGNWAWGSLAGNVAVQTDGISIIGDGTSSNKIRLNNVITTSSTATFDAATAGSSVFHYTGGTAGMTITNGTAGRIIWIYRTVGTGSLNVYGFNMSAGTAASFIYNGSTWVHIN